MKMKFRKLIAAVCAGCLLMSNISFADLPVENSQETPEQEVVQQTEELNPSDEIQTVETASLSEREAIEDGKAGQTNAEGNGTSGEEPTEMNDQPTVTEAQQEAGTQEQGSQPESQSDIPNVQPENQEEDQAEKPETQNEQQSEETRTQTESQPEDQEEDQTEQPKTQNKQQSEETKTQTKSQPEDPAEDQKEEPGTQPEQQAEEQESQTEPQPETQTKEEDSQEETENSAEDAGEEENIQTLEIGEVLSGTIKSDETYKARLIPEWDLELVFTLKVPAWGEGAAHIRLKDEEIDLIRKETEDPEAQDILYTFEETVTGGETYDFILNADWEIPFTLKVERKEATEDDTTQAAGTREDVPGEISQKAEIDEYDSEAATKKAGIEDDREKKTQETGAKGDAPEETPRETETGEDNLEQIDELAESTETVYLPAGSLEFTSPEFTVTASFADGVIPEGTTLEAEEILPGTELYEQITGLTLDRITDNENKITDEYRVLDIRFMLKGEEIEPLGSVDIIVVFADPLALNEEDLQVLHFADGNNMEPEKIEAEMEGDIVSFCSDEFSIFVFTATRSTVNPDITDLLTGVNIEGAEYDPDGKLILVSGRKYKIDMSFQEKDDHQFVTNGTTMKYKLPDGLTISTGGTFDMSFGSLGTLKGNAYTIEGGYLNVQWNTADTEMMAILNAAGNAHFNISMEGIFGSTGDTIHWNSSVNTEVNIQEQHDLDIAKAGTYDKESGKVKYTVTVNSKGSNTGVQITDTITGSALISDVQSINNIVIKDKNGQVVSGATVSVQNNSFVLNLPNMKNEDRYTIEYTASVDYTKLARSGGTTYLETNNGVMLQWDGDGGNHETANSSGYNIDYSSMGKSVTDYGDVNYEEDGRKYRLITWEIEANPERKTHLDHITDTIGESSQSIMKMVDGLTVIVTKEDNTMETRTLTAGMSGFSITDTGWTYNPPESDGKASYKISYKTKVDTTDLNTAMTVTNTAEDGISSADASQGIAPNEGSEVGIAKTATSVTEQETAWSIDLTVPANGLSEATVIDELPFQDNLHQYDIYLPDRLEITGLMTGESYSIDYEFYHQVNDYTWENYRATERRTGQDSDQIAKVFIKFYKNSDESQTGLNESGNPRVVTVKVVTRNNPDWLAFAEENTWAATHTNTARIGQISATADANPWRGHIIKNHDDNNYTGTVTLNDGKTYKYYKFYVQLNGVTDDNVEVFDTFDTSLFEVLHLENLDPATYQYHNPFMDNGEIKVGDSVDYQGQSGDVWMAVTDTNNGALFSTTQMPKKSNGTFWGYYRFYYYLVLKNEDALISAAMNGDGTATFTNAADWNSAHSDIEMTYGSKVVDKNVSVDGNEATFTIVVNPNKLKLNNGNQLILRDTFGSTLSINYNSISITTDPASAQVTYDYSGNTGTFVIPDETKAVITYKSKIIGNGNLQIYNNANLEGKFSDSVDDYVNVSSSGSGGADIFYLNLLKYAANNMQNGSLAGAKFRLLDSQLNPITYSARLSNPDYADRIGKQIEFTTGSDGMLRIMLSQYDHGLNLKKNTLYYLEEIEAPTGYAMDGTLYSFAISDDPQYARDDGVWIYYPGDILKIRNYPEDTQLVITKRFGGNVDLTAEQKNKIRFTITGPEGFGTKTVTYADFVNGKYILKTLNGGTTPIPAGTYTVTENVSQLDLPEGVTHTASYTINAVNGSGETVTTSGDLTITQSIGTLPEATVTSGKSTSVVVTNDYNTHAYNFSKLEAGTEQPLHGATFTVKKAEDGTVIKTYTTGWDGGFSITWDESLYQKNVLYYICETQAPQGFDTPQDPPKYYFYFGTDDASAPANMPSGTINLSVDDASQTVYNASSTSIMVQKEWKNANGTDLSDTEKQNLTANVTLRRSIRRLQTANVTVQITSPNTAGCSTVIYHVAPGTDFTLSGNINYDSYTIQINDEAEEAWIPDNTTRIASYTLSGVTTNTMIRIETGSWNPASFEPIYTPASNYADPETDSTFSSGAVLKYSSGFYKVWDNLDKSNSNGDQYYYYVTEDPINGFTTSYGTPEGIQQGTLTVTNTKEQQKGSLKVTKTFGIDSELKATDLSDAQKQAITFTVTDGGNHTIDEFTYADIASKGYRLLEDLTPGNYTVTETVSTEIDLYTRTTTYKVGTGSEQSGTNTTVDVAGGTAEVTVTNTYTRQKGSLKVNKSVDGGNASGRTYYITIRNSDGLYVQNNTGTLAAGAHEFAIVPGTPLGITELPTDTYTVTEIGTDLAPDVEKSANLAQYLLTVTTTGNPATVANGQKAEVTINNKYSQTKEKLKVSKTVARYDSMTETEKQGSYTFLLAEDAENDKTGYIMPSPSVLTKTVKHNETAEFDDIVFVKAGTYYFTITEQKPSSGAIDAMTYDTDPKIAKVVVTNTDGTLTSTVTYGNTKSTATNDSLTVTNSYFKVTAQPVIQKIVSGTGAPQETFTFQLSLYNRTAEREGEKLPENKTVTITVLNDSNSYEASFDAITFTQPGIYVYQIDEVIPDTKTPGMTYSTAPVYVTITVDENSQTPTITYQDGTGQNSNTITNTYQKPTGKANLKVKKTVTGSGYDKDYGFTFTLTKYVPENGTANTHDSLPNETTVTVKNNEEKTFGDITFDAEGVYYYTITESAFAGTDNALECDTTPKYARVEVKYADETKMSLEPVSITYGDSIEECNAKTKTELIVKNKYSKIAIPLKVQKILGGADAAEAPAETFVFTLTGSNGAPMPTPHTATVTGAGEASFGEITVELNSGTSATYTYTIKETVDNSKKTPGMTYSANTVTATVVITRDDDGTLDSSVTYSGGDGTDHNGFTNTYVKPSGEAVLSVAKQVVGNEYTGTDSFTFTLAADSGEKNGQAVAAVDVPMPANNGKTVTVTNGHAASFGKISFNDGNAPGTYWYKIQEKQPAPMIEGMACDTNAKWAQITVTSNATNTSQYDVDVKYGLDKDHCTESSLIVKNIYQKTQISVEALKRVEEEGAPDVDFTFVLTNKNDATAAAQTQTVKNGGKATFGPLVYTSIGTYVYEIKEIESTGTARTPGMTYNSTPVIATVNVTIPDATTGALQAAVTYSGGAGDDKNTIVNHYHELSTSQTLSVNKDIEGNPYTDSETFIFDLSKAERAATDPDSDVLPDSTETQITYSNAAGSNHAASFGNITYTEPGEYWYTIQERLPSPANRTPGMRYDTTVRYAKVNVHYNDNNSALIADAPVYGTVKDGTATDTTLTVRNKYQSVTADISVTKDFTGREWSDEDEFEFTLTAVTNGAPMPEEPTGKAKKDRKTVTFSGLTFTNTGDYKYTIQETAWNPAYGVSFDTAAHNVTVRVEKETNSEALKATVFYDDNTAKDSLTVSNTYAPANASVQFIGKKALDGRTPVDGEFKFVLYSVTKTTEGETTTETEKEEQTVTNIGEAFSFNPIEYTKDDTTSLHYYRIKEIAGTLPGVTYDNKVYDITVRVYDNGKGQLLTEVTGLPKDGIALFTNAYDTGSLSLQKKVTGNAASEKDIFQYTVTLKYGDAPLSGSFGGYEFGNGVHTFNVSAKSPVLIEGLPAGTTYTVTETIPSGSGYTCTGPVDDENNVISTLTGTIEKNTAGTACFTNNKDTWGKLAINKTVAGNTPDNDKLFSFTIQLSDTAYSVTHDLTVTGTNNETVTGAPTSIEFIEGEATVKLKHGQTATVLHLPNKMGYTVTETSYAAEGYVTTVTGATSGTINANADGTAAHSVNFTNTRNMNGSLTISKVLDGNTQQTGRPFTVHIKLDNATFNESVTGTKVGANSTQNNVPVTFAKGEADVSLTGGDSITINGLPNGIGYTITETPPEGYETPAITVNGVTGNAGKISSRAPSMVVVTNTYNTVGSLKVTKSVAGNNGETTKPFHFKVTLGDSGINGLYGATTETGMTFSNGVAEFDLADGESRTATNLPNGLKYTVEEDNYQSDGYVTEKTNWNSTIVGNATKTAAFTNIRNLFGGLKIRKVTDGNDPDYLPYFIVNLTLNGKDVPDGTYGDITVANGQVTGLSKALETQIGTETANKVKDSDKDKLIITKDNPIVVLGLPAGVTYSVTESDPGNEYQISYDEQRTGTIAAISSTKAGVTENLIPAANLTTITNTRDHYTALKIEKVLDGNVKDDETEKVKSYQFRVQLKDKTDTPVNDVFSGIEFVNGETYISLRPGQTIALSHIPKGYKYTVTETADSAYTASYKVTDESGSETFTAPAEKTIGEETAEVVVTNYKDILFGGISLRKEVSGEGANTRKAFDFTVTLDDTQVNGTFGDATFTNGVARISISQANSPAVILGLKEGIGYTITEDDYAAQGYLPDKAQGVVFTGTVVGKAGCTTPESVSMTDIDDLNKVVYKNIYSVGRLAVSKKATGNAPEDSREFAFVIQQVDDGKPRVNEAAGINHGDASFTNGRAEIVLKGGETKTITGLPAGYSFTVTEENYAAQGYETKMTGGTSGSDERTRVVTIPMDENVQIEADNHRDTWGGLIFSKEVTGNAGSRTREFAFALTLSDKTLGDLLSGETTLKVYDENNVSVAGMVSGSAGSYVVKLKHGWHAELLGVGNDVTYVVREQAEDNYTLTQSTNISGTIKGIADEKTDVTATQIPAVNRASFTNHRDEFLELTITKSAAGNATETDKEFEFTIQLFDAEGNSLEGSYGGLTFGTGGATFILRHGDSRKITDIPNGTRYVVTETDYNAEGYITYSTGYAGEVQSNTQIGWLDVEKDLFTNSTDDNTELKQTVAFVNLKSKTSFIPTVKKAITGLNVPSETYTFKLTDKTETAYTSGETLGETTATVNGAGTASFGEITYTKPGTYVYEITEVTGKTIGMTYASGAKKVTVTVVVDINSTTGEMSKTVTYSDGDGDSKDTITNSYIEPINVSIQKVWKDYENRLETRPAALKVKLLADGKVYKEGTLTESNHWMVEEKDLPKYDKDGKEIVYTWTEETPEGYIPENAEVNGTITILTNVLVPQKTSAAVQKEWKDYDNRLETRPATLKVKLLADGKVYKEGTLTESNHWMMEEKDLPKYDKDGKEIVYTWEEETPEGYTPEKAEVNGTKTILTNVLLPQKTSATVQKVWKDYDNRLETRPAVLKVRLLADGKVYKEGALTESNHWMMEEKDLPKYDKDGKEIVYTWEEETPEGYTPDNAEVNGTITILTNVLMPPKTNAAVHKVWKDDENRDDTRPVALTVRLLADGQVYSTETLTAANNWTLMKKDLPKVDEAGKEIVYTWEEVMPTDYELESTETSGMLTTLTNVYVPEKTSVSVKKVWNDNGNAGKTRPESIKVQLFANGKAEGKPVTLNDSNGWAASWTELNKYKNGNAIRYTVEEVSIPAGYTSKVSGSAADGFVITNSIELASMVIEKNFSFGDKKPEDLETRIEVPVQKVWVDFDNRDKNRPDSITVHLYADGERVATARLTEDGGWKNTFRDLPKYNRETSDEIVYTISEDPVAYYKTVINHFTIVNQYEPVLVNLSVSKIWDDDGNDMKIRPKSIHMTLSNGTSVLLSASNGWTATITELPTVVNGQPVDYSWTEQEVPGYRQSDKDTAGDMTVFTNKVVKLVKVPADQPQPKVPGAIWYVFEEYDTALGGDILINHVGDCFD